MDKILNSNTLADLAENINELLASKEKISFSALYRSVKERYKQYSLASLFDNNKRFYDIFCGNRCVVAHLYLNWIYTKSPAKNRAALTGIADEIQKDFIATENVQISEESIRLVLEYLEQCYGFCTKLFTKHRLNILLPACGHMGYNSFCRTSELTDGSVQCSLYLLRHKKNCTVSPEYVLFHELGHVLHTMVTGSYNTVPDSFFDMSETIFPELSTTYRNSASEFFADCFAMGTMLDSEWNAFDPYPQIYAEDKRLFEQYMRALLE